MVSKSLIATFAVLSLFAANPAAAADSHGASLPSESLLREISAWLSDNFGLPATADAPTIKFASREQLAVMRSGGLEPSGQSQNELPLAAEGMLGRGIVALYKIDSETIFLPSGWTGASPAEQSVLVHEMVHHLQQKAQLRFECPMAREKLAYAAQNRWLERFGSNLEAEFEIDRFTLHVSSACFY
jgi:hypothetical protein